MENKKDGGRRNQKRSSTTGRDGRRSEDRYRGKESRSKFSRGNRDFQENEKDEKRSRYSRKKGEDRRESQSYRKEDERFERKVYGKRSFDKPKPYNKRKESGKPKEFKSDSKDELIRLNRFLSRAGICSRREADEFIQAGVVTVNGEVVTELGTKVRPTDVVKFHDQTVGLEKKVYVLLNKPKNCVTTMDDPRGRMTVMDLVGNACDERIYPVGRLDRNTTGVLLLTNDGDLAARLTHPRYEHKKIYHVVTDNPVKEEHLTQIASGIELEDGFIKADSISYVDQEDKNNIGIEIHSGKNRIVRRIFESLGYQVVRLDRVYFAGLTKKGLRRGDWRHLTAQEVAFLQMNTHSDK
ncbi:MAG: pseudouridine synthase [Bacteroidales bacterium]|nr:pseudouridine synthase [Bacteroidales bacterium]